MRTIVEAFDPNVPYRVRQRLGPWITRLARTLGQPEYRLHETGYVGTVQQPLNEFTEVLQEHGFDWDLLAWYHQPPVGSKPNGSWTYRPTLLADRQIHVILVAHSPEYMDIFAHEEYNWLRHPIKHVRQVGIKREAASSKMWRWLESHGVNVDTKPRRRRRVVHAVKDLRKRLRSPFRSMDSTRTSEEG